MARSKFEHLQVVPKSELEVLDQEIRDAKWLYRVRARDRVHYLTIPTTVFDDTTMSTPHLLIQQLPDLPDSDWTRMFVSRKSDGSLTRKISSNGLPALNFALHSKPIDLLSLPRIRTLRPCVHEVLYDGRPAIAKYRCFNWNFHRMNRENEYYDILWQYDQLDRTPVAPKVLAYLTENGRTIGLLLEKIEGHFASIEDLAACEKALRILHDGPIGLIHGDVNRSNFIVDSRDGHVRIFDFERSQDYNGVKADREIESLRTKLME